MNQADIDLAVRDAVCEALALEADEVTPEATLTRRARGRVDHHGDGPRAPGGDHAAIDPAELQGRLTAERVIDLFSVQNLADLVTQRAALASA